MALDNANFIAELSITDPPGSDPLSQGDDQIRTIKRATFQSFPLIAAAVNLTDVQMNLMAIKNEANVFTAEQTLQNTNLNFDDTLGNTVLAATWLNAGVAEFQLANDNAVVQGFKLRRFVGGVAQADVFTIPQATGIVDFDQVPTVQGAPLWVAGEVRMFVTAQVPGTNWFKADGTNGTVSLTDRALIGSGLSLVGNSLTPNLIGTAISGQSTGSTAISVAQMPIHRHKIWSGNQSGITDTTFSHSAVQTVAGANRGNTGPFYDEFNSVGTAIIENTGSGSGHTHTSPAQGVIENGTDRNTVRPLSFIVDMFQYVP